MRRTKRNGSFFLCLIMNMLLNIEGIIPIIVLLVLHFVLDISIWWAVGVFLAWIIMDGFYRMGGQMRLRTGFA